MHLRSVTSWYRRMSSAKGETEQLAFLHSSSMNRIGSRTDPYKTPDVTDKESDFWLSRMRSAEEEVMYSSKQTVIDILNFSELLHKECVLNSGKEIENSSVHILMAIYRPKNAI